LSLHSDDDKLDAQVKMTSESGLNQTLNPPTVPAALESDDRWSLVLRVATSRPFTRAVQLHDILIYIGRRALTDPATSIREYDIGCNALGRKPDFNPNEDNIVRVQIGHLRKKLDEYFATDGRDEPIHITVPKGTYLPRFEPKTPPASIPDAAPILSPQPAERLEIPVHQERARTWRTFGLVLLALAAGAAMAILARIPGGGNATVDPILREAWSSFARHDANVLLSTATPLNLIMVPDGHEAYGSPTYSAPPEAYSWFRQHRPLAPGAKLSMTLTDNMVGVGTMNAAVAVAIALKSLGATYQILPERVATLAALRGRNSILFGLPADSDAISRTMEKTPLVVDYEPSVKEFVVRDRISGDILVPERNSGGDFTAVYGLITVLRPRDSDRGGIGMLIFSGITSGGTQGAAEFFTSPRSLRKLRGMFAHEGLNGFPAAYQVVVRCAFDNLLLLNVEYYSHRIIQKES
jgi:hypothetical protein